MYPLVMRSEMSSFLSVSSYNTWDAVIFYYKAISLARLDVLVSLIGPSWTVMN